MLVCGFFLGRFFDQKVENRRHSLCYDYVVTNKDKLADKFTELVGVETSRKVKSIYIDHVFMHCLNDSFPASEEGYYGE